MTVVYEYTKGNIKPSELMNQINSSNEFSNIVEFVIIRGIDAVSIGFDGTLSPTEKNNLDGTITTYTGAPDPTAEDVFIESTGLADPTRGDALLSLSETTYIFSEKDIKNNDWLKMGEVYHSVSGYIMPHKGRIVRASAHVQDQDKDGYKYLDIYVDDLVIPEVLEFYEIGGNSGSSSGTLSPILTTDYNDNVGNEGNGIDIVYDNDLNITFNAGQKIRTRGNLPYGGSKAKLKNVVMTIWVKWELT